MLGDAHRYAETDTGQPTWPWVFQLDTAKIDGYQAITAARLGQPKLAADAFARTGTLLRSPKQAALVTVEHARSLAAAGHLGQACTLAMTAHELGCTYDSERVRQAVREFRTAIGNRGTRITADLDERLHSAYATRANRCG